MMALGLLMPASCWAGQVCFQRSTNALIEYQSVGTPGTCTKNATSNGIPAADVEERMVTAAEWATIKEAQIDQPAKAAQQAREQARHQKALKLRQKLGLTDQEFEDLRDALRD